VLGRGFESRWGARFFNLFRYTRQLEILNG
jgi:hypothetical protein